MRKLTQDMSRLKLDLKNANRWTNFTRIVNKLSGRTHNKKEGLGFQKESSLINDFYYICGQLGHLGCLVAARFRNKRTKLVNNAKLVHSIRSFNLLPRWASRNKIHLFDHKKGPKLV